MPVEQPAAQVEAARTSHHDDLIPSTTGTVAAVVTARSVSGLKSARGTGYVSARSTGGVEGQEGTITARRVSSSAIQAGLSQALQGSTPRSRPSTTSLKSAPTTARLISARLSQRGDPSGALASGDIAGTQSPNSQRADLDSSAGTSSLVPLPDPERSMAQTEALLRQGTLPALLEALHLLRRMVRYHPSLVHDCL